MTKTFKNYLKEEMDIAISGGDFLTKITLFLWNKVGFIPKTKLDFEIVVRILKNYVKLSEGYFLHYDNYKYWKIEKPDLNTLKWLKEEIIPFFSKGLELPKETIDKFDKRSLLEKMVYECEMMNFNKIGTEHYIKHWDKAQNLLEKLKVVD